MNTYATDPARPPGTWSGGFLPASSEPMGSLARALANILGSLNTRLPHGGEHEPHGGQYPQICVQGEWSAQPQAGESNFRLTLGLASPHHQPPVSSAKPDPVDTMAAQLESLSDQLRALDQKMDAEAKERRSGTDTLHGKLAHTDNKIGKLANQVGDLQRHVNDETMKRETEFGVMRDDVDKLRAHTKYPNSKQ